MDSWPFIPALFIAGLAGSGHCMLMCGPLLCGFSRLFQESHVQPGTPRLGLASSLTAYHLGRLWTYGMLGLAAGWLGGRLHEGVGWVGWQQGVSVLGGVTLIAAGLAFSGLLPGLNSDSWLSSSGWKPAWLARLARTPAFTARLLVGVVMGFLPCGLVYAMLIPAAALPTPLHSAAAMIVFGLGTLPALSGVHLLQRALPWARLQSRYLVPAVLVLLGSFLIFRTLSVSAGVH